MTEHSLHPAPTSLQRAWREETKRLCSFGCGTEVATDEQDRAREMDGRLHDCPMRGPDAHPYSTTCQCGTDPEDGCMCLVLCPTCEQPWPEERQAPLLRDYDVREVEFHPGEWQVVEIQNDPSDKDYVVITRLSWPGPLTYMQAQMLAGACQEAARRALQDNGLLPETKP